MPYDLDSSNGLRLISACHLVIIIIIFIIINSFSTSSPDLRDPVTPGLLSLTWPLIKFLFVIQKFSFENNFCSIKPPLLYKTAE